MKPTDKCAHIPNPDPSKCSACGVPMENHLGIWGTCAELLKARARIRTLEEQVKHLKKKVAWK